MGGTDAQSQRDICQKGKRDLGGVQIATRSGRGIELRQNFIKVMEFRGEGPKGEIFPGSNVRGESAMSNG